MKSLLRDNRQATSSLHQRAFGALILCLCYSARAYGAACGGAPRRADSLPVLLGARLRRRLRFQPYWSKLSQC